MDALLFEEHSEVSISGQLLLQLLGVNHTHALDFSPVVKYDTRSLATDRESQTHRAREKRERGEEKKINVRSRRYAATTSQNLNPHQPQHKPQLLHLCLLLSNHPTALRRNLLLHTLAGSLGKSGSLVSEHIFDLPLGF